MDGTQKAVLRANPTKNTAMAGGVLSCERFLPVGDVVPGPYLWE